ncbi:immunoglobulin-binding protein 1-like isoform X2 [Rhinopithecus roxellana]|uniref:immunoglobulin-binding protein 1-like isoform X2 n=1 Tax=Rhinopithecus roxellana TaxID=61622 RepID=UPI0012379809|nr:immunoglobulin-binding protein 1-like isoform X2 [Rhinopithecus roxellana]
MAAEDELLLPRLPELFETGKQLLDEVEVATEPAGSRIVQEKVFKGLDLLEKAAEMLSQLDLFSRNEDLEEIASTDLKYLLVPAFQGALTMKQVSPSKRLDHLQRAREHFMNYLTQCHYYHVAEFELPKTKNNSAENHTANSSMAYPSLVAMASQRQAKRERVFGAGYPSLATMTVSDWYEQHRKYGALPDQGIAKATPEEFRKAAQQQEEQEEKEEEDDEQTLHRAREWDDWKDTHPRGYGNRQNMG